MFTLHPHQQDMIDQARVLMQQGHRAVLIQSPTGSGKTVIGSEILRLSSGNTWWMNHRKELIDQSSATFLSAGVDHGYVSAGYPPAYNERVQVCSVPSVARRLGNLKPPTLMVWDECHHIAAKSWENIFTRYPQCKHIGLSATPERLDGRGLNKYFSAMVTGPSVKWLINNNYLSDYKYLAPDSIDRAQLKLARGEYTAESIAELLERNKIIGNVILEYQKQCPGARSVVFAPSVKLSLEVADRFNRAGIPAMHIDGTTNPLIRSQAVKDFKDNKIKVLSNVNLFGEGFDLPALDAVSLLKPTASLGFFLQMVGRPLRYSPGKTALILDHVGNYVDHGMPCMDREWSLDSKKRNRKSAAGEINVKTCEKCFGVQDIGNMKCKYCGHPFRITERDIEEVDGDLVEIDKELEKKRKRKEIGQARTLEDLKLIGKQRGYKDGWAEHIFKARMDKYGGRG